MFLVSIASPPAAYNNENGWGAYMQIKRLRDLREDNDLTQAQIGRELGISQRLYSYYERGERTVPPEVLIALADLYETSVDYILGRTDDC